MHLHLAGALSVLNVLKEGHQMALRHGRASLGTANSLWEVRECVASRCRRSATPVFPRVSVSESRSAEKQRSR